MSHTTTRIFIDKVPFDIDAAHNPAQGSYLRQLGKVPDGFDLWLKRPGEDDLLVKPDASIPLKDGMHFYSAKSELTPGD